MVPINSYPHVSVFSFSKEHNLPKLKASITKCTRKFEFSVPDMITSTRGNAILARAHDILITEYYFQPNLLFYWDIDC